MATDEGAQEVVVIFDATGAKIERELTFEAFQKLLARREALASHAASQVRAAYAQVGAGLAVRALVFFLFKVDEEGKVDASFNLPLAYMASNAGLGPDLGLGRVRVASRAQCPVPWHAINLWEPAVAGDVHPALLVQKTVWRNRLGLKTAPVTRARRAAAEATLTHGKAQAAVLELDEALQFEAREEAAADVRLDQAVTTRLAAGHPAAVVVNGDVSPGQAARKRPPPPPPPTDGFREEMQRQQQGYLEQIKACRDEIQKLKSALRHERERNRRLQQLLRGDV